MKYPNDFLTNRSSPNPQGGKDRHVVVGDGGDFRQRRVGGTVTKKKGDFVETKTIGGTQQVALWYTVVNGSIQSQFLAEFDMNGTATIAKVPYSGLIRYSPSSPSLYTGRVKYLGDNFFAAVYGDGNDPAKDPLGAEIVSWPAMVSYPGAIKQRYSSPQAEDSARAVSWIDVIQITGMPVYDHQPDLHGSGWDASLSAYRYAFTCSFPANPADPYKSRAPVAFYGDTKNRGMAQAAVPFYPGRDNTNFCVSCIGPGRLQSLLTVAEDLASPTMIPPYLVMSTDHGQTWSSSSAAFLDSYLYRIPLVPANPAADPPTAEVREHYDAAQLYNMSKYHVNVYVGGGKNILIIPNGYTGMVGDEPSYCAMAFLGTEGGGYTRLSWPPDAWPVDKTGDSLVLLRNVSLARFSPDDLNAQMGFGVGCMYLSVFDSGVRKLLVTYNFGSTWEVKTVPSAPAGTVYGLYGCIVKPYISAAEPGEMLFANVAYATGEILLVKTDGTFSAFEKTAARINRPDVIGANNFQLYAPFGQFNEYPTNFNVNGKQYIFPAYPGEFDKP